MEERKKYRHKEIKKLIKEMLERRTIYIKGKAQTGIKTERIKKKKR
jgi:hypothetical protein